MPHLTPVRHKALIKFFESRGFEVKRQRGSHLSMTKAGCMRPIIIPIHNEVTIGVIQSNLRTAGISRDDYMNDIKNFL